MALVPNFSYSQNLGSLDTLSLADSSTGSDGTVTQRRIFLEKHDGTYLVPVGTLTDYIVWAYASSTKDIADILDQDFSLDITVQWLAGSTVVYTKTILANLKGYAQSCLLDLTRFQTSNPDLINGANYWTNKSKLRCLVDDADEAVTYGSDQTKAQLCLTMAKELVDNQSYFFD